MAWLCGGPGTIGSDWRIVAVQLRNSMDVRAAELLEQIR
ncbi:hypothetical protein CGLO_10910 [Colletotrichum gloeosporioides Cg-14]|uniref:Uncharacterized protein n=1 Tax=Colletotrichum gloeosporioides (strain Cg-14) TaxID=1237896 RepID=T0LDB8_COLGC|nr:hypothetical protein CGLO_10910 [Colletotrichum gloeosporioides Cg-14]